MDTQTRALGYARVSTDEQARTGYGIGDQRDRLTAEIAHRGWDMLDLVVDDGESGKDWARPGIRAVLARLAADEADALVVTKLDRLTRSALDFAQLLVWAGKLDVRIVVLDIGVDTSTDVGRLVAGIMSNVAEWERRMISDRTRAAAAQRRKDNVAMGGGGVRSANPELADRITAMRAGGSTWQAIADRLNAEGVPTVRGGALWRVSSIQSAAGYIRPPEKPKPIVLPSGKRRRNHRKASR